MKSKHKISILAAGLVVCAALLGGCAQALVDSLDTTQQDAVMTAVFDAVENGDADTLAQHMSSEYISDDVIRQMIDTGSGYIEGTVKEYKKTGWYINKSTNSGGQTTTLDLSYDVATDYEDYVVSMRLLQTGADSWEVVGFNVIRAAEFKVNGAIINFDDIDMVQVAMLLVSAAELALMIVAIVVCARSKVRRKALWIVLIVLLHTGLSLKLSPAGFNFNIWLVNVSLTSLQKFIDGTRIYNILVPLGAILFLSLKKRLERSAAHHTMMQQYRQDYVPPYAPSEDPPEEVMGTTVQPAPEPPEKTE